MPHTAAVPFIIKRSKDEFSGSGMTSTTETIHGLLRLDGERVLIQWRLARKTEELGSTSIRTDEEMEQVKEVVVPLEAVAGAFVRRPWWEFWKKPQLVVAAADLRAFDELVGQEGLRLKHPAKMAVGIRRGDLVLAEEFSAELTLAVAELAARRYQELREVRSETPSLPAPSPRAGRKSPDADVEAPGDGKEEPGPRAREGTSSPPGEGGAS